MAAIPGDGTPCVLHRVTERSAGGRQFLIAELLHDGATVECVVGPDLSGIVRELVGSVLVPSIVDRGDRMPLLQDVRVAKGGDADGELPF